MSKSKANPRVPVMREAIGKIVAMITERDIKVTQRGHKAFVQFSPETGRPVRVNIPYLPDDASDLLLDAVQGFIDHEVGHIFYTDFDVLTKANRIGLGNLHNVIEDTYIERKMKERFPGSAYNIGKTTTFFLNNYTLKELKKNPKMAVSLLMVPAIRAWSGQVEAQEFMTPAMWDKIDAQVKRLGKLVEELPHLKDSQECLDLTIKFHKALTGEDAKEPPAPEPKPKPPKRKRATEPKGGSGGTPEPTGEGAPGEEVKPEEPPKEDDGSKPEAGKGLDFEEKEEVEPGDEKFVPEVEDDSKFVPSSDEEGMYSGDAEAMAESKDEEFEDDIEASSSKEDLSGFIKGMRDFDDGMSETITDMTKVESKEADYLIYTRDLDEVVTYEPPAKVGDMTADLKRMSTKVDHMVGTMQKDLERAMAARSRSVWKSGLRRGRLNPSSLARVTMGDDRVFRRREVSTSKNVAVQLVVDLSGSMSGTKVETAMLAAYGMSLVLDRMSLQHEILGFTTHGWGSTPGELRKAEEELGVRYSRTQSIYMPIFKNFSERLTPEIKKRLACMPSHIPLQENVDGESVEMAVRRLIRRDEQRKICIVLSDGQPACPGDSSAQRAHLKRVVEQAQAAGIDMVGIGIQSDAVRHYYKKHVVLNDVADLSGAVIKQLRALLLAD